MIGCETEKPLSSSNSFLLGSFEADDEGSLGNLGTLMAALTLKSGVLEEEEEEGKEEERKEEVYKEAIGGLLINLLEWVSVWIWKVLMYGVEEELWEIYKGGRMTDEKGSDKEEDYNC